MVVTPTPYSPVRHFTLTLLSAFSNSLTFYAIDKHKSFLITVTQKGICRPFRYLNNIFITDQKVSKITQWVMHVGFGPRQGIVGNVPTGMCLCGGIGACAEKARHSCRRVRGSLFPWRHWINYMLWPAFWLWPITWGQVWNFFHLYRHVGTQKVSNSGAFSILNFQIRNA